MSTKTIAIIGITGNQGASVADTFLSLPGWHVRGISRDPSQPSALEWVSKGAEVVPGNLDDPASLEAAFTGAHVVFGYTDFMTHMRDPAVHERAAREGRGANEVAYEREVAQGKRLVDAVAAVDGSAGGKVLERFVLSTLSSTKKWSKGKYTRNLHFDGKWEAVEYLREKHPSVTEKTSFLQMGMFAGNWKAFVGGAPQKQEDGSYQLGYPLGGDVKFPMVDPRADTGVFVKALVEVAPGKNLVGAGNAITWNEWSQLWGKHHGVACTYAKTDPKELETHYGSFGQELADMFAYMEEFGYDGGDPEVVYPWDLGVDVPVTTMEEHIRKEDWSPIL
ncbi:NAD(P)-binding protein [Aaosphaeria arxii CBS 175.79]|uniref:NAD(P)-binding protein n=1 Tax=Aaosphaeria arxii CBS 175.79 TaxID=1450172 RepID=A0A6A5XRY7_9PLEO|nr:NAD(P)-binding protein [Aaosphaeria arxii CBS 175.79]KAF2015460.1 NAD(P)-binding protein [Aaosphaeria arxii CBS 175.79]